MTLIYGVRNIHYCYSQILFIGGSNTSDDAKRWKEQGFEIFRFMYNGLQIFNSHKKR